MSSFHSVRELGFCPWEEKLKIDRKPNQIKVWIKKMQRVKEVHLERVFNYLLTPYGKH